MFARALSSGAVQGAPDHVCYWAVSGCCQFNVLISIWGLCWCNCFYLSKLHLSIWLCLSIFHFGLIVESYHAAVSRKYCLQNSQGCSIHPSIHPSIYLSISLSLHFLSIYLSIYLSFFRFSFLSFSILPGRHGGEALRPAPQPPLPLYLFLFLSIQTPPFYLALSIYLFFRFNCGKLPTCCFSQILSPKFSRMLQNPSNHVIMINLNLKPGKVRQIPANLHLKVTKLL